MGLGVHVDPIVPPPPLPPPADPPPVDVDPIVPPPPEPVDRAARPLGGRNIRAYAYYKTTHGKVVFYPSSMQFIATCEFPGHGDCGVSRTCGAAKPGSARFLRDPHCGRYAACLVAWLELASCEQTSASMHRKLMPDFPSRRSVRDRLKLAGPNAVALLEAERDNAGFEADSEPSDFDPFEKD